MMGAPDDHALWLIRIEKERLAARLERMTAVADALVQVCSPANIAELEAAKAWDGTPDTRIKPRMRRNPEDLIQAREATPRVTGP